jgi:PQQ-dependent dehydrogenase (methanol/ethanol family)
MLKRLLKASALGLPLLALSVTAGLTQQGGQAPRNITPVTDTMLRDPPAGDWLMWRRTYNAWGYSPLEQINKSNVKNLKLAWTWSLTNGPTETTPIVHDGVLFIFNYADKIQALDAANGDLIWEYKRDLPAKLVADAGNPLAKRNMAIYEDKLIVATSDAHLVALDVKTGKVAWDHATADWSKGWRYTGGPFVANGTIVQGMTGCGNAQPGGCFVTGHDPKTGAEKWRVHTIAQSNDPNFNTWNGLPMEARYGGSAWISGAYDPDQNLVFYGTGQPYPWIAEMNGLLPKKEGVQNSALYTDSTLAIDASTGNLKWYRQHLENDTWDLDYVYERLLIDLTVNGEQRKALVTTGKLGIIEAIDRTNGQWLWHKETVHQNVVSAIDPKTGAKTINQASIPHIGQTTVNCPADPGSRGWPATAYSPKTGMLYLPLNEYCSNTTPTPLDPGQAYTGGGRAVYARVPVPNSDGKIGSVQAVKLSDQSTAWSYRTRAPQTGAVLPTGGGLVFSGAWDRYFRAFDDTTGQVLWEIRLNNAINAFPVTYTVNGKQYVAIAVGNGSSHARTLALLTPELKNPDGGSALWVFALPD